MRAIVSTARLWMREVLPQDAPVMFAMNNDPEVMRFTGDRPFPSLAAAETFIRAYPDYQLNGFGRWAVILKGEEVPIGWCGLKRHTDGMIDLGYRLVRPHWGNGYATEASHACLDWGFQRVDIHEVLGRTARENRASVRVLEKIGMRYWRSEPCEGIPDSLIYRIRRSDPR
ncbi:MAG: GNAT family N-acetyltransferase [Flavobacteriales bacterium]|nr:GNAT family N-acetyltransferase [Flavobacteriales bacterium]MCB9167984.1 GNAT family N-acetyltransferase [Flavobacteriales bacterium]